MVTPVFEEAIHPVVSAEEVILSDEFMPSSSESEDLVRSLLDGVSGAASSDLAVTGEGASREAACSSNGTDILSQAVRVIDTPPGYSVSPLGNPVPALLTARLMSAASPSNLAATGLGPTVSPPEEPASVVTTDGPELVVSQPEEPASGVPIVDPEIAVSPPPAPRRVFLTQGKDGALSYLCPSCSRFRTRSQRHAHKHYNICRMARYPGNHYFECSNCSDVFRAQRNMRRHQKSLLCYQHGKLRVE